ncbi:DUF2157 domain-containing protein [Aromatoleum petrolei]|uniref:DUF2157 domain-containing protein n=1 Tax=Aromatoleum petrolei TaxID=76116 RepID=A0ABX1MKN8_9RHOO|nr:DUF2157 domain-containing protein [Aromatoleum petrolei]NMF88523.1 DUF2157 domain-containing protein [Aromatoleum petrolei]QTQ36900.1 putative protein DUF2157 [Aromatoleum petrolei]
MSWNLRERGTLLALAEDGALTPRQLEQAASLSPLVPARDEWLSGADRMLAVAGAILLAAGLIFFFAYNWDDLHRFAKLGIAIAAIAACTGTALAAPPFGTAWRAALLAACLATGALLALIGQTYQSGADVWELFVAWTALMTPFALLARSSASWLLWLVVANAGLLRYLSESWWSRFIGALGEAESLFAIAGFNAAMLLVFEFAGHALLATPRRPIHRVAGLGVLVPLALGACLSWWDADFHAVGFAFAAVAVAFAYAYLAYRRDVPMLAQTAFAAISVATTALIRVLPHSADFVTINIVAVFVIATTGLAGVWLTRLHREGRRP